MTHNLRNEQESIQDLINHIIYDVVGETDSITGRTTWRLTYSAVEYLERNIARRESAARLDEQNDTMTIKMKGGPDGYGQIYHVINGDMLEAQNDRIEELEKAVRESRLAK